LYFVDIDRYWLQNRTWLLN